MRQLDPSSERRACADCGSLTCDVGRMVAEHFCLATVMTPAAREASEAAILAALAECSRWTLVATSTTTIEVGP